MQQKKIDTALALLESSPRLVFNPDYGHLTIAAALGYLDFRHGGRWREGHPNMVAWLDAFADAVPAFGMTMPADLWFYQVRQLGLSKRPNGLAFGP